MAFTGVLGDINANPGNFALGRIDTGGGGVDLEPDVIQDVFLTQTLTVVKDQNLSASNTLTFSQVALPAPPAKTPIQGYTGGQTRYVFAFEADTGQELYSLNADTVYYYPASTTKLMTALLIWEYKNANLTDSVSIVSADTSFALGGVSQLGYSNGDVTNWEDILIAIFVASASEACQAAARIIGTEIYVANGSTGNTGMTRFYERMNERAGELGMTNTSYYDSWGESRLSGNTRNTITARDLSKVAYEALSIAGLRAYAMMPDCAITVTGSNPRTMTKSGSTGNANPFINGPTEGRSNESHPDCLGGKIGEWQGDGSHLNLAQMWTAPNGKEVVIVTMNAETYRALHLDQCAIIYSMVKDWPWLLAGSTPNDPDFAYVRLLVGGDGSIVDESDYAYPLSVYGTTVDDPVIDSPGGMLMARNGDVEVTSTSTDFQIGSGDCCFEVWYSSTDVYQETVFFGNNVGVEVLYMNHYDRYFQVFGDGGSGFANQIIGTQFTVAEISTFFNGAPRHVAFVKNGGDIYGYLNGERHPNTLTSRPTLRSGATGPSLGVQHVLGYSLSPEGRVDDFRVTIGVPRYSDKVIPLRGVMFGRTAATERSPFNDLTLSQTVSVGKTLNISVSNALTLTQRANLRWELPVEHTITLTNDVDTDLIENTELTHTLTMTQSALSSPSFARQVNHTLALTQSAIGTRIHDEEVDHTLTLVDAALKVIDVDADSTVTFTQDAVCAKLKQASATNTLVPTQTVTREFIASRTVGHGLSVAHSATRNVYRVALVSQALTLTHVGVGVESKKTNSELVISQTADATVGKHVRQRVELTQVAVPSPVYNRQLFSVTGLSQVLNRQILLQRQVAQSVPLNQLAVGFVVKAASHVLPLSQTVVGISSKAANNTLLVTDAATLTRSVGKLVDDFVGLAEDIVAQKSKAANAQHAFGMNQFARGTRVLTVTLSNTLALAQDLVRDRTIEDVDHELDLAQTATVSKLVPRSVANTLALNQTVAVAKDYVRGLSHTIVFQNSFEKYVGIGTNPGSGSGQTVTIPAVQVVKVKKLVTLQSDTLVIVLPPPEFNDSEGGTGVINIKRTMAGGRRVYTRDNVTSKLNYQFVIDRKKAIELRNFIMNSNTKFLRMENWKGELWAVQMTNSPFSFGEDAAWLGSTGGNKSSITLEFEGVRLN